MAQSNASNVTPIHRGGILAAGSVAPNFTLHVKAPRGRRKSAHPRNQSRNDLRQPVEDDGHAHQQEHDTGGLDRSARTLAARNLPSRQVH